MYSLFQLKFIDQWYKVSYQIKFRDNTAGYWRFSRVTASLLVSHYFLTYGTNHRTWSYLERLFEAGLTIVAAIVSAGAAAAAA